MVGSFSYPLSQLNRTTQARRQPGSSLKPMTYLAALNSGLQPNTLVRDAPLTYPPIGGVNRYTRGTDYWSPHNYDRGYTGTMTLRRALELSKNLVTARLLNGGITDDPAESLDAVCALAVAAHVYPQCVRFYPFVLGAQPVRPIDLAGFYAAIANQGGRPTPHVIESITQDGREIYKAKEGLEQLPVDPAAVFQLRTILQGVVARGTAYRLNALSPYIGGKTGTSDDFNDAWFMGFSNDVTIAVWVGYDNAKGKRTLGRGQTGAHVALPIFHQIMEAAWNDYAPQTPLPGPLPQAARHLVALPIDVRTGARLDERSRNAFMEYFRTDDTGEVDDARYKLVSRSREYEAEQEPEPTYESRGPFGFFPQPPPFFQGFFGGPTTPQRDYEGRPLYRQRSDVPPPPNDYRRRQPPPPPQEPRGFWNRGPFGF
jgi:membrane carboxypeptidase/penicillin-binding protein